MGERLNVWSLLNVVRLQIIGVTHKDRSNKMEVSFNIVIMEPVDDVSFLVDIVERNDAVGSIFYFGAFSISASHDEKSSGKMAKSPKACKAPMRRV